MQYKIIALDNVFILVKTCCLTNGLFRQNFNGTRTMTDLMPKYRYSYR